MLELSHIQALEPGLPAEEILRYLLSDLASSDVSASFSGSGAAVEAPDTVSGSGTLSTTGTAAITEAPDTVSGTGNTSGGSITGSAAITEQPDTVAASGGLSTSGSAAIAETPDVVSGAGGVGGVGVAAITEGADIASGSGTVVYTGSGASVEAPDVAAGTGGISVSGTASITESPDVVAGVGAPGVRFGCSTISVDACARVIIEESACFITVNFIDENGDPFVPNSAQYRLDDVASARPILAWTPLTPLSSTMLITVTAVQNELLGRPFETHQCIVQLTDGFGNVDNVRVTWDICQVVGLPSCS